MGTIHTLRQSVAWRCHHASIAFGCSPNLTRHIQEEAASGIESRAHMAAVAIIRYINRCTIRGDANHSYPVCFSQASGIEERHGDGRPYIPSAHPLLEEVLDVVTRSAVVCRYLNPGEELRTRFADIVVGGLRTSVPIDAPPAFIAAATDDPYLPNDVTLLYTAWEKAGSSAELHLYESGGHGFDLTTKGNTSDHWFDEFISWMQARGLAKH